MEIVKATLLLIILKETLQSSIATYDGDGKGIDQLFKIQDDLKKFVTYSIGDPRPKLFQVSADGTTINKLKDNAFTSDDTTKDLNYDISKIHISDDRVFSLAISGSAGTSKLTLFKKVESGFEVSDEFTNPVFEDYDGDGSVEFLTYRMFNIGFYRAILMHKNFFIGVSIDANNFQILEASACKQSFTGRNTLKAIHHANTKILTLLLHDDDPTDNWPRKEVRVSDTNFQSETTQCSFDFQYPSKNGMPFRTILVAHPNYPQAVIISAGDSSVFMRYYDINGLSLDNVQDNGFINLATATHDKLANLVCSKNTDYCFALLLNSGSPSDSQPVLRMIEFSLSSTTVATTIYSEFASKFGSQTLLLNTIDDESLLSISTEFTAGSDPQSIFYMPYAISQLCQSSISIGAAITDNDIQFYLAQDGTCTSLSSLHVGNCKKVKPYTDECLSCKGVQYSVMDNCAENCPGNLDYYKNRACNPCSQGSEGCQQCTQKAADGDFDECTLCDSTNYNLVGGLCLSFAANCPGDDQIYNPTSGLCEPCESYFQNNAPSTFPGCLKCQNSPQPICQECKEKHVRFPVNSECVPCISNCANCLDGQSCQQCESGFKYFPEYQSCFQPCSVGEYMAPNGCQSCYQDCEICNDGTSCLLCSGNKMVVPSIGQCRDRCQASEYMKSDGTCSSCGTECLTCRDFSGFCRTCKSGFKLQPDDPNCHKATVVDEPAEEIKFKLKVDEAVFRQKTSTAFVFFDRNIQDIKTTHNGAINILLEDSNGNLIPFEHGEIKMTELFNGFKVKINTNQVVQNGVLVFENTFGIESNTNPVFIFDKNEIRIREIYYYKTPFSEQVHSAISGTNTGISTASFLTALGSPEAGLGQLSIFENFNIIRFINIDLPVNFLGFLGIFSNNFLDFFPNFFETKENRILSRQFEKYHSFSSVICVDFHPVLESNDVNCFFLNNTGAVLTQMIIIAFISLLLYTLLNPKKRTKDKLPLHLKVFFFLRKNLGLSFWFDFLTGIQLEILIASFINFRDFFVYPFYNFLNSILSASFVIAYIVISIHAFEIINRSIEYRYKAIKTAESEEEDEYEKEERELFLEKYEFLIEDLKATSFQKYSCYIEHVLIIRNIMIPFSVIIFLNMSMVQIVVPLLFFSITLVLAIRSPPYKKTRKNFLLIANDACYTMLFLFCLIIKIDKKNKISQELKYNVFGFSMIVICLICITVNVLVGFYELYLSIKKIMTKKKKSQEAKRKNSIVSV